MPVAEAGGGGAAAAGPRVAVPALVDSLDAGRVPRPVACPRRELAPLVPVGLTGGIVPVPPLGAETDPLPDLKEVAEVGALTGATFGLSSGLGSPKLFLFALARSRISLCLVSSSTSSYRALGLIFLPDWLNLASGSSSCQNGLLGS